jgi:putrescine---pyruvate transaminase
MQTVNRVTDFNRLAELDIQHIVHPLTNLHDHQKPGPLIWDRGKDIYLYDPNGTRYLDAAAGMWNVNVGHGRAELAEAAAEQMRRLGYASSFGGFSNQPSIELAEHVARLAPGDLNTILFTAGGSDSNDSAFKLARLYWKEVGRPHKRTIIAHYMGYHGLTLATTQATGIPRYWEMIDPGVAGFAHVMPPYRYRHGQGLSNEEFVAKLIAGLEETIENVGAETVAALIAEPVMGTGGGIVPPDSYLPHVRKLCDRYDVLLIADEVITGFGRTGRWFAMEHWDVVPDIMTVAKGITSGYVPLGGIILSNRVRAPLYSDPKLTLMHGFTYTGHPVACAIGVRNLEIIEREGLVQRAARVGSHLVAGLAEVGERHDCVGQVRGLGMMAGVEFVLDRTSRAELAQPDWFAPKVSRAAMERGLLCRPMPGSDVLAFSPPLTAEKTDVDRICEILDASIAAV